MSVALAQPKLADEQAKPEPANELAKQKLADEQAKPPKQSAGERRRAKQTLLLPLLIEGLACFEVSLHQVPRAIRGECELVFPDLLPFLAVKKSSSDGRELLALPTMHQADFSILELNEKTEGERLRLFLRFSHFALALKALLSEVDPGSFATFPDIDGGAAVGQSSITIYDEVSSTKSLLGYRVFLYMGVQIIDHPNWGFKKLAVHTILLYARPLQAQAVLLQLAAKDASCFTNVKTGADPAPLAASDRAVGPSAGTERPAP